MSYIYVMQNDNLPGLVQIGMTDDNPEVRARVLSNITGASGRFTSHVSGMQRSMSGAYLRSSAVTASQASTSVCRSREPSTG